MINRKRVLTLILASFLGLGISSCASNPSDNTNNLPNQNIDNDNQNNKDETEKEPILLNESSFLSYKIIGLEKYIPEDEISGENEYLVDSKEKDYQIEIKINNPSKFKINSVKISGTEYKEDNLEITNNNSTIKVNLKTSKDCGVESFILDNLKYQVKEDVYILNLNKRYTLFHPSKNEVSVKDLVCDLASSYLDFSFEIINQDNFLKNMDLSYSLYLEDNVNPIKTSKTTLKVGKNLLKFEDLEEFKNYKLELSYFSDFREFGGRNISKTFYSGTFKTQKSVDFYNFVPSYDSVTFSNFVSKDVTINEITLSYKVKAGELLTLEKDDTSISNLYSNTSYTLNVFYKIKDKFFSKFYDFKTLTYDTPTLELISLESSLTSITYEVKVNDTNELGSLEVILEEGTLLAQTSNTTKGTFSNLDFNSLYNIKFKYKYDLNDNKGEKEIIIFRKIKTKDLDRTGIGFETNYVSKNNTITYAFSYGERTDVTLNNIKFMDKTGLNVSYSDDSGMLEGTITSNMFKNNETYIFEVNYIIKKDGINYNLTLEKEIDIPKVTLPTVKVNTTASKNTIEFDIDVLDPSNVTKVRLVSIYEGNSLVDSRRDTLKGSFSNLKGNKTYTLKVEYQVNLNETLNSIKTYTLTKEVTSLPKEAPILSLENIEIGSDTFSANLKVTDPDGVYFNSSHNYFKLRNPKSDQDYYDSPTLNFTNIKPNTTYNLTYIYYYDFKEGEGKVTKTFEYTFTTLNKMRIKSFSIEAPDNISTSKYIFKIDFNNPNFLQISGFTINNKYFSLGKAVRNSPVEIVIKDTSIFTPNKNNIFTINNVTYFTNDGYTNLDVIGETSTSILIETV